MLDQITPLVLTFNEAPNIGRVLERLAWAKEVVIVDSFSTDDTLAIARGFPNARIVQRVFDTFADQCNFGLEQIRLPWALSLDADYVLSEALLAEISQLSTSSSEPSTLNSQPAVSGFSARFRYCIGGRPLRASLYPTRTVLYRKDKARYRNEGHGHRVQIDGSVGKLAGWIDHDDRKSLDRWFKDQLRYSTREAEHLLKAPPAVLNLPDRIRRKIILAPPLVFLYTLFGKGLILEGWPGCYYVLQRTLAELLLSIRLLERRLRPGKAESRILESPTALDPNRPGHQISRVTMLQEMEIKRQQKRERLRMETRRELRAALGELVPGFKVIVFGSLAKGGRFTENSDIDLAVDIEPAGMSLYQLTSLLAERLGRRVDVVWLPECRFRGKILSEGEAWTLPD